MASGIYCGEGMEMQWVFAHRHTVLLYTHTHTQMCTHTLTHTVLLHTHTHNDTHTDVHTHTDTHSPAAHTHTVLSSAGAFPLSSSRPELHPRWTTSLSLFLSQSALHHFVLESLREQGFPRGSVVKHPPAVKEPWVRPLGREDPLEKEIATHSSTLSGKSHGQRSLAGYSSHGCRESDMT